MGAEQDNITARQWLTRYCRDGEQSAFERFYRSHAGRLWKFLRARGAAEDVAYDLLADTFLRFIQTVCKDLRAPVALLYRIAINLQIDRYRHEQAAPFDHSVDAEAANPVTESAATDEHDYLRRLLKTFPEAEQNLLLMRYWLGMTHKEIATTLKLPEGTVRRRSAELLQELRERWSEGQP
ncbi:MAG: sigma-70 family RNA polymerase sigma factor [Gammaproteobacteria bacterium]